MNSLKPSKSGPQSDVLTLESVADLSNTQISGLSKAELIRIIQFVEPHSPQPDWSAASHECDEAMLRKMAFCARECCRHLLYTADSEVSQCGCDEGCGCPHCS